ncbi:MAG: flagellar biosynthesis protein FlgJ [Desulfobacteraceae bacterium]|nr:MAG: flagellar biosynthesis protein FlgJ [Desulfobacteraceae bacterium]
MPDAIRPSAPLLRSEYPAEPVKARSSGTTPSKQLEQACRDFESIFVNYMLQQMRRTVPQNDLFNGGRAEEIYTSMMDNELAKSIAQQRSMGLVSVLYRQLSAVSGPDAEDE